MPNLPAVCEKCGCASLTEVIIRDDTYHMPDTEWGTCQCGGTMHILGGTYSHLGGPLNYCNGTSENLAKFAQCMQELGEDYFCLIKE